MSVFFDKDGFLERLELLRLASGLSKGEFAQRVGVAQIFSRYAAPKPGQKERKVKSPSVETLLTIAREFNTSVDWLSDLASNLASLNEKDQAVVRGALEGILKGLSAQHTTANAEPPPADIKTGTGGQRAKRATG
jgi:transcriptional regulator with XRE-family HTH domain